MYNNLMKKIIDFLKSVKQELKQVTWPTKQQATKMTIIVIVSSIIVGLFIAGLDYVFTQLIGLLL